MTCRLLIRLPNWLGDVVMCLPVIEQAERTLGSSLTLVAPKSWHGLLTETAPRARILVSLRSLSDSAWRGHDQALLLDGSLRSVSQAWCAGIGARLGLNGGGRWALLNGGVAPVRERGRAPLSQIRRLRGSRRSPRPFGSTAAELLALLPGRPAGLVQDPRPRLIPAEAQLKRAAAALEDQGLDPAEPWVLVNLGGRTGSTKGLPVALAADIARNLWHRGLPCLGVAGPGEELRLQDYLKALAMASPGDACPPRVLSDPPPDLPLLGALGAMASVAVTPDGGGRHLLRAAGASCVTLFGPTDPRHSALPGPPETALVGLMPCGPCHLEHCSQSGESTLGCWKAISGQQVLAAVLGLLGSV
ncbi:MAG: hypothetical protein CMJ86_05020 [Planctomycetes bacterium]|nr:hypothetical protein [Planctomycetota bacterium]